MTTPTDERPQFEMMIDGKKRMVRCIYNNPSNAPAICECGGCILHALGIHNENFYLRRD